MQLISEKFDGAMLITVQAKRIDAPSAIQFKDQMRELTAEGSARVILDLGMVDFVDSSGLGAIVASMKQLAAGQVLELSALSPTVDKLFRLTRMDTVFAIHDSSEMALKDLRQAS